MDLSFLFFHPAPALHFIFKIDYIPREEDFKELTSEQYDSIYGQEIGKDDQDPRIFAFLPDDVAVHDRLKKVYGDDLVILNEYEIDAFKSAEEYIDKLCQKSDYPMNSLHDKLAHLARIVPSVITEGTPYASTLL